MKRYVIGLKTMIFQYGWTYNLGSKVVVPFDEPFFHGVDNTGIIPSSFEISDIPAGTVRIYIRVNGQYVRGDGDVSALDNLVLQNI